MTSIAQQLASSQSAGMNKELTCCKQQYALVLPSGMTYTATGWRDFCFGDNLGKPQYALVLPSGMTYTATGWRDFCFGDNLGKPVRKNFFSIKDVVPQINKELTCCKQQYALLLPSGMTYTATGWRDFCFGDNLGKPFLDIRYIHPFCGLPHMEVNFENFPTLTLRMKGWFSRSVLIVNERDERVLRVQRPVWLTPTCEYKILDINDMEIGKIYKDWLEYDVHFPHDLDVRYKAALLASCIFMDQLSRNRRR
ncbi:scramblase domain-containing protein [Phthorimaea operculella]|nr:scramblase domain-containing protein [Phthorimaea operculella]